MDLEKLDRILRTPISTTVTNDIKTKPSSVLVVIYGKEPKLIMTEKPKHLNKHAGEISFPGGKFSSEDSDIMDTAIRETKEEIELEVSRKQIIGQLKPVLTRNSGFTIIPFVAVLNDIPALQPNSEVEEILHIPIIPLLKTLRIDDDISHRALFEAYVTTFEDKMIWGASARILKQMADIFKQNKLL